jgi:hypothetical protein
MTDKPNGDRKIFRDTLVENATGLCDLLTRLNVTRDPELEKARRMLESTINNVDPDDLRSSSHARLELKSSVDEIINKFNW